MYDKELFQREENRKSWMKIEVIIFMITMAFAIDLMYPILDESKFLWQGWISWWEICLVIAIKIVLYFIISFVLGWAYTSKNVIKSMNRSLWSNMKWPVILSITLTITTFLLFTDSVEWHNLEFYKKYERVILGRRFNFFTKEMGYRFYLTMLSGILFYLISWFMTLKYLLRNKATKGLWDNGNNT